MNRDADTLAALLSGLLDLPARLAGLEAEVRALRAEVAALHGALPPALVSFSVAAERLGVSVSTIARRVKDGTIPVRRIGRRPMVDLAGLHPLTVEAAARMARDARGETETRVRAVGMEPGSPRH